MVPGEGRPGSELTGPASSHQARPHSSGFRTFLSWFKRQEHTRRVPAPPHQPTPPQQDSDSDSGGSETSTATASSFAFLPPAGYRPYGEALAPHKFIASGPYTETYRRRVAERERRRCLDSGITLRKKYKLPSADSTLSPLREINSAEAEIEYETFSLPAMNRRPVAISKEHRRAASETKIERPTSYVHVKGKRRAPQPPTPDPQRTRPLSATITRRVKRMAPQPPETHASSLTPNNDVTETTKPLQSLNALQKSGEQSSVEPVISKEKLSNVVTTTVVTTCGPLPSSVSIEPSAPPLSAVETIIEPAVPKTIASPSPIKKPMLHHSKSEDSSKPLNSVAIKENGETSSKPWYKRQFSENKLKAKDEQKLRRPELPEMNFFRYSKIFDTKKATSPKSEQNRFSGLHNLLPNISELDREAAEILEMHKKTAKEENNNTDESQNFSNPRSARILITKFNELNSTKNPSSSGLNQSHNGPISPHLKTAMEDGKLKSAEDTWVCMKCEKRNNSKKIICSTCFSKKPKEEDSFPKNIKDNLLQSFETEVLDALKHLGNMSKNETGNKNVDPTTAKNVPKTKEVVGYKVEEKQKLREIMREMKNSLPKQQKAENEIQTTAQTTVFSDPPDSILNSSKTNSPSTSSDFKAPIKTKYSLDNDLCTKLECNDKTTLINSTVSTEDTNRITTPDQKPAKEVKTSESVNVHSENSLYANIIVPPSEGQKPSTSGEKSPKALLKELQTAINKGDDKMAADIAKKLAQMKVNCTVLSSTATLEPQTGEGDVTVEVYIEDAESAAGPIRLRVRRDVTLPELRESVQRRLHIPAALQRWIVGRHLCADGALAQYNGGDFTLPLFLYLVSPAKTEPEAKIEATPPPMAKYADKQTTSGTSTAEAPAKINTAFIKTQQDLKNDTNSETENTKIPKNVKNETRNIKDLAPGITTNTVNNDAEIKVERIAKSKTETQNVTQIGPSSSIEIRTPNSSSVAVTNESKTSVLESAKPSKDHYHQLVQLENQDVILNSEPFTCIICLDDCPVGVGVVLRECLHSFCRVCLADTIKHCDVAEVICPYRDAQYSCDSTLQEREVRALVSNEDYEKHLAKSVQLAESNMKGTFHCKTADCKGWCVYENTVNHFKCPICRRINCLTCQAIHEGENCAQYQERIRREAEGSGDSRAAAERTKHMLDEMCSKGDALVCPSCQVVLMKKWGCDWVRCSMCKTEICWVTRGARWGPGGKGDTSAGCRCGVNGVKCHPSCNYCH